MLRCIAVVDDDEPVRTSMASLLRSIGLDARTFPSADAFLASGERDFACLITDVQMPGMNGLELQRVVAAWSDPLPVIVMTAYPERARMAKDEGRIVCWLEKPLNGDHLVTCLESVLGSLDGLPAFDGDQQSGCDAGARQREDHPSTLGGSGVEPDRAAMRLDDRAADS